MRSESWGARVSHCDLSQGRPQYCLLISEGTHKVMCVCVHICVRAHVCASSCGVQRIAVGVVSQVPPTFLFEAEGLTDLETDT